MPPKKTLTLRDLPEDLLLALEQMAPAGTSVEAFATMLLLHFAASNTSAARLR